jgi:hypothetical protein
LATGTAVLLYALNAIAPTAKAAIAKPNRLSISNLLSYQNRPIFDVDTCL